MGLSTKYRMCVKAKRARSAFLSMVTLCSRCGIAETQDDGKKWCIKYCVDVSNGSKDEKMECYYFLEPQSGDDEIMTAKQNLMLKECELASKRMRGPV
jgi:hypothetical protein